MRTFALNPVYDLPSQAHGKWAHFSENLSDTSVATMAGAIAQTMWGTPSSIPDLFFRSRWHGDEWARGSYSYHAVNSTRADRDAFLPESSAEKLLFAGEHTCACLYATVPGAFVSGLRAAYVAIGAEVAGKSSWEYFQRRFLDLCDVYMGETGNYEEDEQGNSKVDEKVEAKAWAVLGAGLRGSRRARRAAVSKFLRGSA